MAYCIQVVSLPILIKNVSMDVALLVIGLGVLVFGGEFLVRGAVGFSRTMKLSPLVVGMTIVAFGTSAPELLVSLTSALQGNPEIAVGNVVGSNIANIALVLGITVIIFPIIVKKQVKRIDFPVMMGATLLFLFFSMDGELVLWEGLSMVLIIIAFTFLLIRHAKNKSIEEGNEDWSDEVQLPSFWKSLLFLNIGFVGLYFGADWFIKGAVGIADYLLADDPNKNTIIGVTVVAFGTSAPELVASGVAAYKKETDISVGNLIGSNVFNILLVLGITSMVKPIPVSEEIMSFDIYWVIGVAFLLFLALFIGNKIGRMKGVILLLTYFAYITVILLKVKGVI